MNREAWLQGLLDRLRPLFADKGHTLPLKIRVTCGFPSTGGVSGAKRRIGECWMPSASADKHTEIFVSPLLSKHDEVCETVAHEAAHAALPDAKPAHGAAWKKCAKKIGLDGTPTAGGIGVELQDVLAAHVAEAGAYPHSRLTPRVKNKVQTTRMLKCECEKCGYVCRTTEKWLAFGAPICPQDKIQMRADVPAVADGDENEPLES